MQIYFAIVYESCMALIVMLINIQVVANKLTAFTLENKNNSSN